MTAAAVALCNQALRLLGEASIGAFDEGTDLAESCSTLYADTVKALLTGTPWRFTLHKVQLARLADPPPGEWTYQHALPTDRLVVRQLFPGDERHLRSVDDYELFGDRVYSDQLELWCDYQRDRDPDTWPTYFRLLVRYALAADLAVAVTGSTSQADYWHRRAFGGPAEAGAGGQMRVARTLDAQQQPPQRIEDFPLVSARFGG